MNLRKSFRCIALVGGFAALVAVLGACHSRAGDSVDRTVNKSEKVFKK
jgi:hypothetical protein